MSGVIAAAGITAAAGLAGGLLTKGSGGSGGGTTTTSQQPRVADWVNNGAMQNYGDITRASYEMPGPYQGQRTADMTPEQQALIQQLYGRVGSTDAAYNQASGIVNGLSGFNSGDLQSQYLRNTDLSPYMNPYTQQVIDPSMKLMEQSRQQALNQIGAQANQTGAFGGSRQGISEGVTNAQSELQKGKFGAELYSQNFLNAQNQAVGDIGRNWQEQTANQRARQFDAGFQSDRANQLASLASQQQQSFLAGASPALASQEGIRQIEQQKLADAQKLYEEERMDPYNRAMLRQQALSNNARLVGTGSESISPTGTSSSPLMAGLGTASTVAGLFGTLGKGFGGSSSGMSTPNPATTASPNALAAWNTSMLNYPT